MSQPLRGIMWNSVPPIVKTAFPHDICASWKQAKKVSWQGYAMSSAAEGDDDARL